MSAQTFSNDKITMSRLAEFLSRSAVCLKTNKMFKQKSLNFLLCYGLFSLVDELIEESASSKRKYP